VSRKIFDGTDVATDGSLGVITTLSFRAVRPAKPHENQTVTGMQSTAQRRVANSWMVGNPSCDLESC
jgi:hypothetical protein